MAWISDPPVFDRGMGYACTDRDMVRRFFNADQFFDTCDVYQQFWLSQSQVEHRAERLATGENQGVRRLGQESDRLVDSFCLLVVEVYWFHVVDSPGKALLALLTASTMRLGVTGNTDSSAPIL